MCCDFVHCVVLEAAADPELLARRQALHRMLCLPDVPLLRMCCALRFPASGAPHG